LTSRGAAFGITGPAAQGLLHGRGEVGLRPVAGVDLGLQAGEHRRRAGQPLERPRERRRRRLVPGDEQRHELVAQLDRAHLGAVLVPGGEEHREHVVARGRGTGVGAALGDEVEQERVDLGLERVEARPRRHAAQRGHDLVEDRRRAHAPLEDGGQLRAQGVHARARVEPEDRAEDDLERQRLEPRVQGDRGVARPRGDLVLGDLGDEVLQAPHPLAVERRQHEPALLEVGVLVEQDHRVAADERLEHAGALAGVQHVGRGGEHLPHLVEVADHHHGHVHEQPQGEAAAVPAPAVLEERHRARPPAQRLERARGAGPVRQLSHAPTRPLSRRSGASRRYSPRGCGL
jgi:hypothetical protein